MDSVEQIELPSAGGESPQKAAPTAIAAVEVRRSGRRKRTISARLENGKLIVFLPAATSADEEARWVGEMKRRFESRERKRRINSAGDLDRRAKELNQKYFGGILKWQSISYVTNQRARYGSCTVADATIRLSDALEQMPGWVRDYVIVHEMAHLLEPNHSERFWDLVNVYPLAERARGYLIAKGMEDSEGRNGP